MNKLKVSVLLVVLLCCSCASKRQQMSTSSKSEKPHNYLVVLSLDGFRWDYNQLYHTPTLDSIAHVGSKAEYMIPSFPSKTFPNHYTLVTGLSPDHHGIVSNIFRSPSHNNSFYRLGDRTKVQDGTYYGGEPIWVTAENQGLKTANYFWPGSEALIKNKRPSIWKKYDESVPYTARMDSVLKWLQLPYAKRPHLCMFYFDQPDKSGHNFGPETEETKLQVEHIDKLLGVFLRKMNQLSIKDSINFVIVADHGMGNISRKKLYVLDEIVDAADIDYMVGSNPIIFIEPKPGQLKKVKALLQNKEGISVWEKNEIPKHLHFGDNPNISSLVVVADSSWSVTIKPPGKYFGGTHGYDPRDKDMACIFYGVGPNFEKKHIEPAFSNTNVYNILCKLLQINPAPNDGDKKSFEMLLPNGKSN